MFRRRTPVPLLRKLRTLLWPERGWRRGWRYVLHRIGRLPGSEYSIASGFACGAAMSFTPLVGLHFVLSAVLAWVIRANPIAALIGTVVGNPWTFPFIWVWLYQAGQWMVAGDATKADRMNFSALFGDSIEAVLRGDWGYLATVTWPETWPMLLAAVPTAAAVWLATFVLMRPAVRRYRLSRVRRRRANDNRDAAAAAAAARDDAQGRLPLEPRKENAS